MQLPTLLPEGQLQQRWASILNPVLSLPINNAPNFLQNISLIDGVTVVNHGLGRKPQGWIITDITGAATIYRSAAFNSLTLSLTSNAATTVGILVF